MAKTDTATILFTGMLAAFIERLELAPAALVGHCIGAAAALDYALRRPGDVSRLVLLDVATERTLLAGPLADVSWGFAADPAARDLFVRRLELEGLARQATDASLELQLGDPAAPDPDFADPKSGSGSRGAACGGSVRSMAGSAARKSARIVLWWALA